MSGPWSPTVYRENAYLPAAVRATMVTENRASFLLSKGGSYPGELDLYNTSESVNEFDSELFRVGFDWAMADRWDMRVAVQTGETQKITAIYDGLRVDRMALAVDAVEVYSDRRDLTDDVGTGGPDGRPDLVTNALRGTGQIICNVQRYNPTPAQLAASPGIQGKTKTTVNGVVPVVSPIGLDNTISECVPFNIMGHGQITQAAADYITTPKWGDGLVEQDFAELLVRGEISRRLGRRRTFPCHRPHVPRTNFPRRVVPRRNRRARAAVQRPELGHSRHPGDVLDGQPQPTPVFHGVGDLGRL